MVTKKIVFHFYLNEGWENNFANKIHFKCLEYYSHIFDSAVIVIAVDDDCRNLVPDVKKKFIDCLKCDTIVFKTVKNDLFFEGGTFKREIVDKLDKTDGLVFFAHNKGVTCLSAKGNYDKDSLAMWITAMYYYNMEYVDEVEMKLMVDPVKCIYGTFLMYADWFRSASHTYFSGTFFWLNPGRVLKWANKIPEIFDREYAEWFPGEVFGDDITYFLCSRCELVLCDVNLYWDARDAEYDLGKTDDDRNGFKIFFDMIMQNG